MQIILESIQELKELASLIGEKVPIIGENGQAKSEGPKEEIKPAAEKAKKDKAKTKVEVKAKETPKVEAEVTGIDTTSAEPAKDADIKEENTADAEVNITKEMVREKFNQVVKSGKQKEAKALIENLGAKKLSDVKPEDYATLMKEAEALL